MIFISFRNFWIHFIRVVFLFIYNSQLPHLAWLSDVFAQGTIDLSLSPPRFTTNALFAVWPTNLEGNAGEIFIIEEPGWHHKCKVCKDSWAEGMNSKELFGTFIVSYNAYLDAHVTENPVKLSILMKVDIFEIWIYIPSIMTEGLLVYQNVAYYTL